MNLKNLETENILDLTEAEPAVTNIDFGGRRKVYDRRSFQAKKHFPERRLAPDRRTGFDRRSVLKQKKRGGRERRRRFPFAE